MPTPNSRRRLAGAAAAIPFLSLALAVYFWGVDLPYWDQWQIVPMMDDLREGRLELLDAWRQHGQHRIFVPQLLMLALSLATSWNIRWELAANVALAAVVFAVVTRWLLTLRPSGPPSPARWIAAPAVSLLVFNLNQWENWTWGLQLVVLVNVAAVAGGLRILAGGAEVPRLVSSAVLGAVATYSFPNGFLFWPLGLALVAKAGRRRLLKVSAWIATAAIVAAVYFYRYSFSEGGHGLSLSVGKLIHAAAYVVIFLGAPVSAYDGKLAAVTGLLACGAFAGLALWAIRDRHRLIERALPWLLLAGYGIGSAAVAAAGRLELGLELAMSSRYIAFSNFFWLGLLGLVLVRLADEDGEALRKPMRIAVPAIAASLIAGAIWGGALIHQQYLDRTRVRKALIEGRFHPDLPSIVLNNAIPQEELEALERHRLSLFRGRRAQGSEVLKGLSDP